MCPLMSVPASGSRAVRTARAAFWWKRCSGGAVEALRLSSRNVTPTPSVPPTFRKLAGVQGLPFIISAKRASRTEITLPSCARPARLDPGTFAARSWSRQRSRGSRPSARPKWARTVRAWSRSKRSTAAEFWPSTSGTSRLRMKRVAAIQKSSRTMTMHCTRPPSHCRRAWTSSVFVLVLLGVQPLLELVQHDQHLLARGNALPPAQRRQRRPLG